VHAEKFTRCPEEIPTRVLVLDDEPLIRWAAASTLSHAGFQVIEAADVTRALEIIDTTPVDVALLDVRLPDGDGVDVLKELHRVQPACRCIVMTAFRTPELTDYAAADGLIVLDKPFGMPDLLGLVDTLMATRG
jgi:DNA-binding NtrC family response regulator